MPQLWHSLPQPRFLQLPRMWPSSWQPQSSKHPLAAQPWLRRWYSTSETAEALGLDYDTTLAMIAGDVIHGERENQRAQWRVAVAEVERWRRILHGVNS